MLRRLCLAIATITVIAVAAGPATAARPLGQLQLEPAHLRFNIQAHGITCPTAPGRKLVNRHVKVIRSHTYRPGPARGPPLHRLQLDPAGDGEGEIFDCRQPKKEVR